MFLFSHDWVYFVLDLLRTSLLIFLVICKDCIEFGMVVIIARAHLTQPKIVHPSRVYTFGLSITGIQYVDRWGASGRCIAGICGAASPISVYAIGVFEH